MWCEMVGWLLPSGASNSHEHTSGTEATIDSNRSRTGSAKAAITRASSAASASDSGDSVTDEQQATGSTAIFGSGAEVISVDVNVTGAGVHKTP